MPRACHRIETWSTISPKRSKGGTIEESGDGSISIFRAIAWNVMNVRVQHRSARSRGIRGEREGGDKKRKSRPALSMSGHKIVDKERAYRDTEPSNNATRRGKECIKIKSCTRACVRLHAMPVSTSSNAPRVRACDAHTGAFASESQPSVARGAKTIR